MICYELFVLWDKTTRVSYIIDKSNVGVWYKVISTVLNQDGITYLQRKHFERDIIKYADGLYHVEMKARQWKEQLYYYRRKNKLCTCRRLGYRD